MRPGELLVYVSELVVVRVAVLDHLLVGGGLELEAVFGPHIRFKIYKVDGVVTLALRGGDALFLLGVVSCDIQKYG